MNMDAQVGQDGGRRCTGISSTDYADFADGDIMGDAERAKQCARTLVVG